MNEKILELVLQLAEPAENAAYAEYAKRKTGYSWDDFFREKFAELIIKECITTVQKRFMGDNNREDMEVLRCVSELKNRFGVEE